MEHDTSAEGLFQREMIPPEPGKSPRVGTWEQNTRAAIIDEWTSL